MDNDINVVAFCVWGISKEEELLALKIGEVFETQIAKTKAKVILRDIKTFTFDEEHDICIAFGDMAAKSYAEECIVAPALSAMLGDNAMEYKTRMMSILEEVAVKLTDKPTHKSFVETPAGITVGSLGADIIITEKEAEHLKKIKDLLGGGKIVITKGDLRIEVDG